MPRQLTVLGGQAAYPTAGQPCSGFLLTWDDWRIVLDLGYGTLTGLLQHIPDGRASAIIISHDHPDHWIDLHGLFRLLYYGPKTSTSRTLIPLFCTRQVIDKMQHLEADVALDAVFDIRLMAGGESFDVGPFRLQPTLLPHHVPNMGIRLSVHTPDSKDMMWPLIAYTGDTGPSPLLEELGNKVQLFIVEATDRLGEAAKDLNHRNLLESSESGHWAARANAKQLMLTHFWPGNDRQVALQRARKNFAGKIYVAEPGLVVHL